MHYFRDFKSFGDAEIDLLEPVTILIGPNGSGKSNLIEGVGLLAEIARGRPLHEIVDVGRGSGNVHQVRGGLKGCPREGCGMFTMGFTAITQFETKPYTIDYQVSLSVEPVPHISREQLRLVESPSESARLIFGTVEPTYAQRAEVAEVRYDNFRRGGNKPAAQVRADRSALSQYEAFAGGNAKLGSCTELVSELRDHLRSSFVFDPNPRVMRSYERLDGRPLDRDGGNLSAVLWSLRPPAPPGQAEALGRLQARIRQVPEEPVSEIGFVKTELEDVILGFQRNGNGTLLDARVLSDGTLRCLAVLTALETADTDSRIVIEEMDNGLHPSRVQVLTEALWECAERRELNVLATTHNPATLNALTPEQLESVVVCARDGPGHTSRLVALSDLPRFIELAERGRLGDVVTRRVLEQYVGIGADEKHAREMREWLKRLP